MNHKEDNEARWNALVMLGFMAVLAIGMIASSCKLVIKTPSQFTCPACGHTQHVSDHQGGSKHVGN